MNMKQKVLIFFLETCSHDYSIRLTCKRAAQLLNSLPMMSLRTIEFLRVYD